MLPTTPLTVDALKELRASNRNKYNKPDQTRENYESCIKRGKKCLASCVAARCKTADEGGEPTPCVIYYLFYAKKKRVTSRI